MEFFNTEVKCINKKNDTICDKMHYLKYMKDSASDWYVLNVSDLIKIFNLHKKYVVEKCDQVCPKKEICDLHKQLNKLEDYCEWVRDKNLSDNEIVKTVALVFNKSLVFKEVFWWNNLIEWEVIEVPDDATWSWQARVC